MPEFAQLPRAIIHGALQSKKLPDPSFNYEIVNEASNMILRLLALIEDLSNRYL